MSGDAIVPGQLVYVTFTLRGLSGKRIGHSVRFKDKNDRGRYDDIARDCYQFRPIVRSVVVLSKTGPLVSVG